MDDVQWLLEAAVWDLEELLGETVIASAGRAGHEGRG